MDKTPTPTPKKQLINAHTHVFTGNFVPPFLAKSIVPWPFFYLLNVSWVISLFKIYYSWKRKRYGKGKNRKRWLTLSYSYIRNNIVLYLLYRLVLIWLGVVATLIFAEWFKKIVDPGAYLSNSIDKILKWMADHFLYFDFHWSIKLICFLAIVIFIKWSRNFLIFIIKNIWGFLKKMPNETTLALINRYLMLGRFAFYKNQQDVAERALHQLPPGSGIVILPMDMEYMGAGKTKMPKRILKNRQKKLDQGWLKEDFQDVYKYQMRELWEFVKKDKGYPKHPDHKKYYPFLFLDPRRIAEEKEGFFDYEIGENGKIKLKKCFVKTYMEDRNFCGFKIYPALGYYPFDEFLLPIWRYANENNIPIMTHCIIGVVYYRGLKKPDWDLHPIFKDEFDYDKQMLLPETKNLDFQLNFTHPMNYLCLVEEPLLREVVSKTAPDSPVRELFPIDPATGKLAYDLSGLKICMAHFGGEKEWTRYMEQDREVYSQRLLRDPQEGINFIKFNLSKKAEKESEQNNNKNELSWNKLYQIWHKADWYSIICSMLIDYNNLYADISYIISKESIYPLLKYTLEKGLNYQEEIEAFNKETDPVKKAKVLSGKNKLRSRVLFGTDFYVVRNHKSDKDLFVKTKSLLAEEEFDLITRDNPYDYLKSKQTNDS